MVSIDYRYKQKYIWYNDGIDEYWHTVIGDKEASFMSPSDAVRAIEEYERLSEYVGIELYRLNAYDSGVEKVKMVKVDFKPNDIKYPFMVAEDGRTFNIWDDLYPMEYLPQLEKAAEVGKQMREAEKKFREIMEGLTEKSVNWKSE